MNRPSQTDSTLAHPLSLTIIGCVGFCLLARFCLDIENHGTPSILLPLGALLLAKRAGDARKRVAAHDAWRGAWQEMAGDSPTPKTANRLGQRASRAVILIAVWFGLAGFLAGEGARPGPAHTAASIAFLLLTLWGLYRVLRGFGRIILWLLPTSSAAPARAGSSHGHVVSVCLSVPSRSPTPKEFTRALPPYCTALLANNAAPVPF